MQSRCLKALQLMRQASVVCSGGGIQRRTGDLKEVDNKQFQTIQARKAYFPEDSETMAMTMNDK
jgi:hypothetical protein